MAAVGVSASVFNLVSKLFNVPLLNITTSFVAEEQALINTNEKNIVQINIGNYFFAFTDFSKKNSTLSSMKSWIFLV